jgi:acid phosphatase (class A)
MFYFLLFFSTFALANNLNYLSENQFSNLKHNLLSPPEIGSLKQKDDEKIILDYQNSRLTEDCKRASFATPELLSLYGEPFGPLKNDDLKSWVTKFENLKLDLKFFIEKIKLEYNRKRPVEYIKNLSPCISDKGTSSYPSSQATIGYVYEQILIRLFTHKKQKIHNRANQIANDRILSGIHHPSDIAASKILAKNLIIELKKSSKFREDFRY